MLLTWQQVILFFVRVSDLELFLKYLSVAADLSRPAQMIYPTVDIMGKQSQLIKDILHKSKRW